MAAIRYSTSSKLQRAAAAPRITEFEAVATAQRSNDDDSIGSRHGARPSSASAGNIISDRLSTEHIKYGCSHNSTIAVYDKSANPAMRVGSASHCAKTFAKYA